MDEEREPFRPSISVRRRSAKPEKRGDETPLSKGAAESISFALPASRKQINRAYTPVLNDGGMAPCHTNSSL